MVLTEIFMLVQIWISGMQMASFYGEIYSTEGKHNLKSGEISAWRLTTVTLSVCAAWWAPARHRIKDFLVWFTLYFFPQGWCIIQGTRWMLCSEWAAIQYSYPPHTMCHPVPYLWHSIHTLCWIKNCWTLHAVALITAGTECFTNVSAWHCCEMRWYPPPFVDAGGGNATKD